MVKKEEITGADEAIPDDGVYACMDCGLTQELHKGTFPGKCELCQGNRWVGADG